MLLESKSSFFTSVSGSIFSPEKILEDEKSQSLFKLNIKQESVQTLPGNIHYRNTQAQHHPDRSMPHAPAVVGRCLSWADRGKPPHQAGPPWLFLHTEGSFTKSHFELFHS